MLSRNNIKKEELFISGSKRSKCEKERKICCTETKVEIRNQICRYFHTCVWGEGGTREKMDNKIKKQILDHIFSRNLAYKFSTGSAVDGTKDRGR